MSETQTLALAAFLTARIEEIEAAAHLSMSDAPWILDEHGGVVMRQGSTDTEIVSFRAQVQKRDLEHIARHDPARVLAECEAHRRIVEWVVIAQAATAAGEDGAFHEDEARALTYPLQCLATAFADHPDFQESWRP